MRRRFLVTLVMLAIAMIGLRANGMAPVIVEIPSPIVADDTPVTNSNHFVYPDAFNLDYVVSDDFTTPGQLVWSYTSVSGRYSFNNVGPLTLPGDSVIAPGAKRIDNVDNDTDEVDGNPRTVTIRDTVLSPIAGPDTPVGTPGIVNPSGELVTLFASDGTTAGEETFLVFTEKGGTDRLSGVLAELVTQINLLGVTDPASIGWATNPIAIPGLDADASFTSGADGFCMEVGLTGNRFAQFESPYGIIPLVANSVWRIRAAVDTAGVSLPAGTTPLWDILIENTPSPGVTRFGGDYLFHDNLGGADSPASLSTFDVYWTPPAVMAADWNDATTGMFTAAKDASNDARITFRVIDVDDALYGANTDQGKVCLRSMEIHRLNINSFFTKQTPYNVTNITDSASAGTHNAAFFITAAVGPDYADSTVVTYAGGNVTFSPNTAGLLGNNACNLELVALIPGNTTVDVLGNPSETPDNYPVPWESSQLLKISAGAIAPNATGASNPPDVIRIGADTASIELLAINNIAATVDTLGFPKTSGVTDYTAFFYTHNKTVSAVSNIARIRPTLDIVMRPEIVGGGASNLGGITFTYQKVEEVTIP